jgi:hypothetical protein
MQERKLNEGLVFVKNTYVRSEQIKVKQNQNLSAFY